MRRLLITTTVVSSLLFAATPAFAGSPWWHITSGSRPSNIQPGGASDDLQQVTVSAGSGSYELVAKVNDRIQSSVFQSGEKPEQVRAGIEAIYGGGTVEVTATPGSNGPDEVYEIKFGGELTDRYVAPLRARNEQLVGGAVTVKQLAKGPPDGVLVDTVENVGDGLALATGSPVRILDTLPAGLRALRASAITPANNGAGRLPPCSVEASGSLVSCTFSGKPEELAEGPEKLLGGLPPYYDIEARIAVEVTHGAGVGGTQSEDNRVSISGGEAPPAAISRPVRVSEEPPRFGVEQYELTPEEPGGALATQAGSHPFQIGFNFALNQQIEEGEEPGQLPVLRPVEQAKDLRFKLPPGLVGNPTVLPQCSIAKFITTSNGATDECPADTAVGLASVTYQEPEIGGLGYTTKRMPVFNLEPQVGEPARFGFYLGNIHVGVYIDVSVRAGSDYGVASTTRNIVQDAEFVSSNVTLWGVPGDPAHDSLRGWSCLAASEGYGLRELNASFGGPCTALGVADPPPFLDLPTSCPVNAATGMLEPMRSSVEGDSWQDQGNFATGENIAITQAEPLPALQGCNHLQFVPDIKVTPDSQQASKPTGLDVDVHVPQEGQLNPNGLAQSNIKDITVKLPAGVAINPSSGDGLEACSAGSGDGPGAGQLGTPGDQIGFTGSAELAPGSEPGNMTPQFTPYLPGTYDAIAAGYREALQPGVNFCPNASKIGEVTIHTPLLPNPLKGFVYLAAQEANPFSSVLAMYVVAEDPVSGALVKLPGEVQLCQGAGEAIAGMTCEALGQIVSTFENSPQLPFEDAELHFFGGERAPLALPPSCSGTPAHPGEYTTEAVYTPWDGAEAVHSTSSFQITSGPNGAPCPGASGVGGLPFNPSLTGGALSVNAGVFSPFDATFSRLPGEQNMQSIEVSLPPGLSGILADVELCPEPQANLGECGPNSLIGETTVSVGVGGEPYTVSGGKFYLTGPYNGTGGCTVGQPGCAPFGITFEVPAKAGPFDFANTKHNHPACDCVLVRAKIKINPLTTAITITSNPPGTPDAIPTSIEGIPLEIQHVNAITTRSNFQFNPTNCNKMQVTGTIHSSEGDQDTIGVPFQVTNCAAMKFEPKFQVSARSAKDSRLDGASLTAKVSYPSAPQGTLTNIARVKVELPKALPSRLNTLRKACTNAQFEANPAGCPAASKIGMAVVHTPILPVPLTGPAIFVSHGGEAWPTLTMVLQGDGVTVDLVGTTLISKAGVTSTTFKTVPDQPFSSFELTLPQGEYSALTALGNLCKQKLVMPTEFIAQNGAEIQEATKVSVTGCPRAKKAKQKTRHGRHKTKASRGRKKR